MDRPPSPRPEGQRSKSPRASASASPVTTYPNACLKNPVRQAARRGKESVSRQTSHHEATDGNETFAYHNIRSHHHDHTRSRSTATQCRGTEAVTRPGKKRCACSGKIHTRPTLWRSLEPTGPR